MTTDDVAQLMEPLKGVRRSLVRGLSEWRYHGRLVARQLDDAHLVVRAEFDARKVLLQRHPETFSVPPRFAKHMMVVCDLVDGDPSVIEDAINAAWELQRRR